MTSSTPPTSFWQRVTARLQGRTPPGPGASAGDRKPALPLEEPAFSEAMAERFRAAMPGEAVAVAEPCKLSFATGDATVNLGRIRHVCRANPHGFEDEASHFVAATANALRDLERPPERSQLRLSLQLAETTQAVLGRKPELGAGPRDGRFVYGQPYPVPRGLGTAREGPGRRSSSRRRRPPRSCTSARTTPT